jgi:hypothetical protein
MYIIATFNHTAQAVSTREIWRQFEEGQYKPVLLWLHKIRSELEVVASSQTLSGEVEIDGVQCGGYLRPRNVAKTRKDRRRIPYRAKDRELIGVLARQRGGPNRTWVVKSERDADLFVKSALKAGTAVFTDCGGGWSSLRSKFKVRQVNHKKEYCTPEACTNQVESAFAATRVLGRVHRHITQNYFDLYFAEVGWRLQRNKWSNGEGFSSIMQAMSRSGPSPLRGYFQGRKRSVALCRRDGSVAAWSPPSREERRKAKPQHSKRADTEPLRRKRSAKTCTQGFEFVSAEKFIENPDLIPDRPGVYVMMVEGGGELLAKSSYVPNSDAPVWVHEGSEHLYTGETYGLRTRLRGHLQGDRHVSNFRQTLLALQFCTGALPMGPAVTPDYQRTEEQLSDWLRPRVLIGFKSCHYIREEELNILRWTGSPLNINNSATPAYADVTRAMLGRFRDNVASQWPEPPSAAHPRRFRR